jgi:hypothetical protein
MLFAKLKEASAAVLASVAMMMLLYGCGSGGTTSVAVEKSAIVMGKVVAAKAAKADGDPITVSVASEPDIKATVGADGTFTLRGLPAGSFTLVFVQGTTEVGRLEFREVAANQQVTISVQLVASEIVLVDEDRRGIGNAGVELEGLVDNVVTVSTSGDSRFVIAGRSVVAQPGVTAIREGNTRKTVNDVTVGKRVHVKGTTVTTSTDVLAYEIMIQSATETAGGTEKQMTICHIPPGNPTKPKTITVGASAWPAHQAHGDTEGECK